MNDLVKKESIPAMTAVSGFARTFERTAPQVDDLIQETLVKLCPHQEKVRPGTNMKAWHVTILRNGCFSQARQRRRDAGGRGPGLSGAGSVWLGPAPTHALLTV